MMIILLEIVSEVERIINPKKMLNELRFLVKLLVKDSAHSICYLEFMKLEIDLFVFLISISFDNYILYVICFLKTK